MPKFSKDEKRAATDKFRKAAKGMRDAHRSGDGEAWQKHSDDFIDAQYEGLPKRFLLPGFGR